VRFRIDVASFKPIFRFSIFFADLRSAMMTSLKQIEGEPEAGMFINSCFAHCQSELQDTWFALDSPMIHNKVIVIHKTKLPYA
jgi:hypothetical protein